MTLHFLTFEPMRDEDGVFGLSVTLPSGEERVIGSITRDGDEIAELCERLNRLGVSECHLFDVIEDLLP